MGTQTFGVRHAVSLVMLRPISVFQPYPDSSVSFSIVYLYFLFPKSYAYPFTSVQSHYIAAPFVTLPKSLFLYLGKTCPLPSCQSMHSQTCIACIFRHRKFLGIHGPYVKITFPKYISTFFSCSFR